MQTYCKGDFMVDTNEKKEYAIKVSNVSKMYKLYQRNRDRMIDSLGLSRKKLYKEHYALNDINFEIKNGESVGIIGTNGAGKSTILKIITGVLKPTTGTLDINGRISALLELGAGFNQEYTGIENIYLNGTMLGYSREEIDAKMDDILAFADIGDFVYQPVKSYSSGMFVRLAFAVAINIDPEILIVDEALSVGDVFFQAKCYKKFEDFKKQGKTILFVSHDLSSIRKYCDRVILFNKGHKLAEGAPKEMIDLYKKILTGSKEDIEKAETLGVEALQDKTKDGFDEKNENTWSSHFEVNPDRVVYGSKEVEIIDFGLEDETGNLTSVLSKDADFVIKYKVRFNEKVKNPIFTYTFKNVKGLEVTGTNTLIERSYLEEGQPGEEYTVSFKQNMNLQGGDYLLSMSCTGYDLEGNLKAYHRCYDLLSVTVISDKDTVGFYDMYSKVEITKN